MQNSYAIIMDLHKGICFKNTAFFCTLDRQIDTLSLSDKKLKESKKDFAVTEKPLKSFSLEKYFKGFSILLFPRPFSQKRGEVRSGVFIKGHPREFLSGNSSNYSSC